ncbi:hypothetical protein FRC12_002386 [Ceratobasidium sp. 428]|nr:hypothetical protein FRC12_002386 [Ceratobasidium sp. 428]
MALNPSIRYEWIDQNWSQVEASNAREVVKQHMRRCLEEQQREHFDSITRHPSSTTADTAATRLNKGYASFLTSGVTARPTSALFSPDYSPRLSSPEALPLHSLSVADVPGNAAAFPMKPLATSITASTNALNTATVELEHRRFMEEPVILAKDMEGVSAIDYWLSKSSQLPLIYKVALDILPAQASSVSSERVFSSSKMTCTQSRNRISASSVEALQIFKHALRSNPDAALDDEQNILDFMTQHDDELSGHNVVCTIE